MSLRSRAWRGWRQRVSWPISNLFQRIEKARLHRGQHFTGDLRADFAGGNEIVKAVNLAKVLAEGGEHPGVVSRSHDRPPTWNRFATKKPTSAPRTAVK